MASTPASSGRSSPVKSVSINRGNSRVSRLGALSPGLARNRFLTPRASNLASRRAANAPQSAAADNAWQDIDTATDTERLQSDLRLPPPRDSDLQRDPLLPAEETTTSTTTFQYSPPSRGRSGFIDDAAGDFGAAKSTFWADPATPGMIALYLQVGFNVIMLGSLLYGLVLFYLAIKNDVNLKVEEYAADVVDQIARCTQDYVRNHCEPSKRVPGMEAACQQWERCMNKNPQEIGRAKVSAETFGMIIEAFFQPIGIKSMLFLVAAFAGSFLLVNGVFASRLGPRHTSDIQQRRQQYQHHQQHHQQHQHQYTYAANPGTPEHPALVRATLQSSPLRR